MAKKKYKSNLSVSGIEQLKRDLLNYKQVELPNKVNKYVSELLKIGITVSQARVNDSPLGKYVTLTSSVSSDKNGCKGVLIAKGAVKESEGYAPFSILLAIEFGAGIHFNPTPNPNADKFGLGVGTFPGQIHAFEDMWFYWDETSQEWKPTHGVKATMPMYNAQMELIKNTTRIAQEVFK